MLSCLWPWWNWAPNTAEGHLEWEVCSKVMGSWCLWRLALLPVICVRQPPPWPRALVDVPCVTRGLEIALSSRNIWVEKGLLIKECSDRMRGNGIKLKEDKFRLDIRKKFLTVRVVRHWHRLPREAMDALTLEVFKARLDGALSTLV